MGLNESDYEFYMTKSDMGELGKNNREAFYKDEDLNGNDVSNKLRIMFAINQCNEGVHAPDLDGVIMGRNTQSDIVFFEQLGRALSVKSNQKEYELLELKTKDELINECQKKELSYTNEMSKEELIEMLLSPVIIDLSNNINFIKKLENNLKEKIKEYRLNNSVKKNVNLHSESFNIHMINENLFEILCYARDRLNMTWMEKYKLAKTYYEHYNNLEIPIDFKTINGYEYDEFGISLGKWIVAQRSAFNGTGNIPLTSERIELLSEIGMRFEANIYNSRWQEKYELAKIYYEHYGNLEIPQRFKTQNGYKYDEKGIALGKWINTQRRVYRGLCEGKLTSEQIKLLSEIGMRFEANAAELHWQEKYKLAKIYYEHYGNLEIPHKFKTKNGYEYDEKGIALGNWIIVQRQAKNNKNRWKISPIQISLLEKISMRFEANAAELHWQEKYKLAKIYYEHYGNLEIPHKFKTKNGYEFDESGVSLGTWIASQKKLYKNTKKSNVTSEKIEKLEEIGLKLDKIVEIDLDERKNKKR